MIKADEREHARATLIVEISFIILKWHIHITVESHQIVTKARLTFQIAAR